MIELLSNPLFIVFASITLYCVVSTVAVQWRKVRQAEIDAALKHEMIQRGMSADDIQKVLEASSRKSRNDPAAPKQPEYLAGSKG
jgi:hypothetical protein